MVEEPHTEEKRNNRSLLAKHGKFGSGSSVVEALPTGSIYPL
jgi:hypothetical protein